MFGLTFEKLLIIGVIAAFIIGPDKLPMAAQKLGEMVRWVRDAATGAKERMREEMGDDFDDVDWRKLDPRQYDPRRIIRDAWAEPAPGQSPGAAIAAGTDAATSAAGSAGSVAGSTVAGASAAGAAAVVGGAAVAASVAASRPAWAAASGGAGAAAVVDAAPTPFDPEST